MTNWKHLHYSAASTHKVTWLHNHVVFLSSHDKLDTLDLLFLKTSDYKFWQGFDGPSPIKLHESLNMWLPWELKSHDSLITWLTWGHVKNWINPISSFKSLMATKLGKVLASVRRSRTQMHKFSATSCCICFSIAKTNLYKCMTIMLMQMQFKSYIFMIL